MESSISNSAFTMALVNRDIKSNFCQKISYGRVTYMDIQTRIFRLEIPYVLCPVIPRRCLNQTKMSDSQLNEAWAAFWKRLSEKYLKTKPVKFTGKNKTYHSKDGKTAIVVERELVVCDTEHIDTELLKKLGYKEDENLSVPLLSGEGYYRPEDDHHRKERGLIYW